MKFIHVQDSGYGELKAPTESERELFKRLDAEDRERIWRHLQQDLDVPEEMKDLAIAIWRDGKND
jgi:hypothetical protein